MKFFNISVYRINDILYIYMWWICDWFHIIYEYIICDETFRYDRYTDFCYIIKLSIFYVLLLHMKTYKKEYIKKEESSIKCQDIAWN